MENNNNSNGNNTDLELDRFRQILNNKINEKKNQIFPLHSRADNNNMQHEINCLKWVLGKINQRIQIQIQISQVEDIIQKEINDLNGRMTTKSITLEKETCLLPILKP